MSGIDVVKTFSKAGWIIVRERGSHIIMEKEGVDMLLTVPRKNEVKRGTLRSLIADAGMTVDEFVRLSKK
jgi:predicted RNA binding protein YcfA (HicA-like mRNA interferase family)